MGRMLMIHTSKTPNGLLQGIVKDMNDGLGEESLFWKTAPTANTKHQLVDSVHLNEEAYEVWDEALYPPVLELFG
jgi:lysophospholipase L1-like esterase